MRHLILWISFHGSFRLQHIAARSRCPSACKVVIVTMFEIGADTGDKAGEVPALARTTRFS